MFVLHLVTGLLKRAWVGSIPLCRNTVSKDIVGPDNACRPTVQGGVRSFQGFSSGPCFKDAAASELTRRHLENRTCCF